MGKAFIFSLFTKQLQIPEEELIVLVLFLLIFNFLLSSSSFNLQLFQTSSSFILCILSFLKFLFSISSFSASSLRESVAHDMATYIELPPEIHLRIFKLATFDSVLSAGATCRKLRAITQAELINVIVKDFDSEDEMGFEASNAILRLDKYWVSRILYELTEPRVRIWLRMQNSSKEELHRIRDADEKNFVDKLKQLTDHGASFVHQPHGRILNILFENSVQVTPMLTFMLQNGASFQNVPYRGHSLLCRSPIVKRPIELVQLLLDNGITYLEIPGGHGRHILTLWFQTVLSQQFSPVYLQLLLEHDVDLRCVSIGLDTLLMTTFYECGESEWVETLLERGATWSGIGQSLGDTLATAYRELRSSRREKFLRDNKGDRVLRGEIHAGLLVEQSVERFGEGPNLWKL